MSRRTFTWNAYETSLQGALTPGSTSVTVDSTVGLVAPVYLVLDPDVPDRREWVRVNTINGNTLENIVRNLGGSVGDVQHDAGAKIRAMFAMQNLDDIFLDILDNTDAGGIHISDGGDPHSAAGYLKLAAANNLYINRAGDIMSGLLTLSGAPLNDNHAATKVYVDDAIATIPPSFSGLHADLTDLPDPSAHHTRYTDNEAQSAMGPNAAINPFHHDRYTDPEAVAAVGPHTVEYTDAQAIAAVSGLAGPSGFYTRADIDAMLVSYYTHSTDPRAVIGRRIYISSFDPGAIGNNDIWHQTP